MNNPDTNWTVEGLPPTPLRPTINIWGDDGDIVAEVYGNMDLGIDAIDRAEKIVRAVGAFDALVKIYKAAKAWQDMDGTAASIEESPFTGSPIILFSDEWS